MGMQSVFVVGGEELPVLPEAYAMVFIHGGCCSSWNKSSIGSIEDLRSISYWGIGDG